MTKEYKAMQAKLLKEIKSDIESGQAWTICHQHRKCLYYMQQMIFDISQGKDLIIALKDHHKGFNESLLEAQESANKMEKGLQRRQKSMIKAGTEEEYQKQKSNFTTTT